jgi:hypothetical protein
MGDQQRHVESVTLYTRNRLFPCRKCKRWFRLKVTAGEGESLIPPPFHGTTSEDAAGWWRYFDKYCTYTRKTTIEKILAFFAVLMRDGAADWLESLMPPVTKNELHLEFEERFITRELVKEFQRNQAEVKRLASELEKSSIAPVTDRSRSPDPRSQPPYYVSFDDQSRRPSSPTEQDRQYRDDRRSDVRPQQNNRNEMTNQRNARPLQLDPHTQPFEPRPATDTNQSTTNGCYRCGKKHNQAVTCRALGVTCYLCGKINHFSRMCKSAERAGYTSGLYKM